MRGQKEITLLPQESDNNSLSSRIIRYSSSIGRYIIVFTELIVISAFLSRFWLDRQNSDLSETLRQQKAIVDSTAEFDKEYSSLQSRLKYIDTQYKNQPKYVQNITALVSSLPADIFFQNLTLNRDTALVSIYSYQEDSLVNLIVNLSQNPNIATVDIRKIEKKSKDAKYFVDIFLKFKPKSDQPAT